MKQGVYPVPMPKKMKTVATVATKGGCGKTTITAHLALRARDLANECWSSTLIRKHHACCGRDYGKPSILLSRLSSAVGCRSVFDKRRVRVIPYA
jgi:Mrp family chromosome partitioning ATPase